MISAITGKVLDACDHPSLRAAELTESQGDLVIYGDPHGDWAPLLKACEQDRPGAVVILGDFELTAALRAQIRPVFDRGIRVRWIPGNHDVDTPEWHDRLWGDYPEGNLHARAADLAGFSVAGLGGLFKPHIYLPDDAATRGTYASRRDVLRQLHPSDRWRGGLPLSLRAVIFPEDLEALVGTFAQILVTHDAPSSHRHGCLGIDKAAQSCGAKLVVHGHHHESYTGRLQNGVEVRGLGRAEVFRLNARAWMRPGGTTTSVPDALGQ